MALVSLPIAGSPAFAFAHQAEGEVREGSQIAARPNRAFLRDDRQHAVIEGRDHLLEHAEGYTRVALGKHVDAQRQEHPRARPRERFSYTRRVRANQILLQLAQFIWLQNDVGVW